MGNAIVEVFVFQTMGILMKIEKARIIEYRRATQDRSMIDTRV